MILRQCLNPHLYIPTILNTEHTLSDDLLSQVPWCPTGTKTLLRLLMMTAIL